MNNYRTAKEIEEAICRELKCASFPTNSPDVGDAIQELAHALTYEIRHMTRAERNIGDGHVE